MKLSVVIPCYNQVAAVAALVQKVTEAPWQPKEIIVVDDGSTDGTRDLLRSGAVAGIDHLMFHDVDRGKGAVLRTGIEAATGDVVIV